MPATKREVREILQDPGFHELVQKDLVGALGHVFAEIVRENRVCKEDGLADGRIMVANVLDGEDYIIDITIKPGIMEEKIGA